MVPGWTEEQVIGSTLEVFDSTGEAIAKHAEIHTDVGVQVGLPSQVRSSQTRCMQGSFSIKLTDAVESLVSIVALLFFNAICLILLNPYSEWMQYSSCF